MLMNETEAGDLDRASGLEHRVEVGDELPHIFGYTSWRCEWTMLCRGEEDGMESPASWGKKSYA